MSRCPSNPLITPQMVKPSQPNMKVLCAMNAGAVKTEQGTTILLLRVAEAPINSSGDDNNVIIPVVSVAYSASTKEAKPEGAVAQIQYITLHKEKDAHLYDFSDSRVVISKANRKVAYLTSLSHLRVAKSQDDIHFEVEDKPFLFPSTKHEIWGLEDPRVIYVAEYQKYFINFTSVSPFGASTSLASTFDFQKVTHHGVIFPPENKDVCIFPERIGGKFYAYHRPVPSAFGGAEMWIAESEDLLHWGNHEHFLGGENNNKEKIVQQQEKEEVESVEGWDTGRIGGGAPSIKTKQGWVHIYHAADVHHRYGLGAFLTGLNDPTNIIKKSKGPILLPEMDYETHGFFPNVVFSCGVTTTATQCQKKEESTVVDDNDDGKLQFNIYYGAADDKMALYVTTLDQLFA